MTRTSTNYRYDVPPAELAHTKRVTAYRVLSWGFLAFAFLYLVFQFVRFWLGVA